MSLCLLIVKFRFFKYLIPFIFLLVGVKGILCSNTAITVQNDSVIKVKIPSRSTHSELPETLENAISFQADTEESDDEDESNSFSSWISKSSNEILISHFDNVRSIFFKTNKLDVFIFSRIYLDIRVLLI